MKAIKVRRKEIWDAIQWTGENVDAVRNFLGPAFEAITHNGSIRMTYHKYARLYDWILKYGTRIRCCAERDLLKDYEITSTTNACARATDSLRLALEELTEFVEENRQWLRQKTS